MRLFAVFLSCCFALASAAAPAARPNIVVILADDQGWGDLGINGNTDAVTPHLDALGRSGARFAHFYVSSVCAPTRAEFFTGRYHPRTGVRGVSTGQERLNLDERTVADVFRAAGYATGAFGKWHNGSQWPYHPNARGFAEYEGFTSGHWAEYFDPALERNGQPVRGRGYIADHLTDRALDFIGRHRASPFFCYIPYNTPHSPWAVPAADWEKWRDRPIKLRGPLGDKEDLATTRIVHAMNENLDRNVGRVLARLDELGLRENTLVVYFSDNGPNTARWNGGLKGRKGTVDEGGLRSPLLVRWPGRIAPGTVVQPIAGAIDLLPTLAALAGVPLPAAKPLDGTDLSPLLLGRTAVAPERLLFAHQNGRLSVRSPTHRLDPAGELFDLRTDPGQARNVAAEQPEVARRLGAALAAWQAEALPHLSQAPAGPARRNQVAPDDRPFPVGYREMPRTVLPARDGTAAGGVQRSSNAPNSSFFRNWTTPEGRIAWDVEVRTAGTYDVEILYTVPAADVGATVELAFGEKKLAGRVTPAWDPPVQTHQDTLPRPPAESPAKDFRPLALGSVDLPAGHGPLTLRALEIPGRSVMEVRALVLTLRP